MAIHYHSKTSEYVATRRVNEHAARSIVYRTCILQCTCTCIHGDVLEYSWEANVDKHGTLIWYTPSRDLIIHTWHACMYVAKTSRRDVRGEEDGLG